MKRQFGKFALGITCLAAVLILVWTVALLDKSYMSIAVPVSWLGLVAWCVAGIWFWKRWSILLLPILALPFLPVSWWY